MGVGAFVWTPLLTAVKCGNAPRNPTQDRGIVFIAYYLVKHEDTHTHTHAGDSGARVIRIAVVVVRIMSELMLDACIMLPLVHITYPSQCRFSRKCALKN